MNQGKRGEPFDYPESLIEFLASPRCFFGLPFRQEKGFGALAKLLPELGVPDYTMTHRGINRPKFERSLRWLGDDVVIAIDASGIKVTNRGEWRRELEAKTSAAT